MTWWFTSDTHFDHANVIEYCKRPFSNVEEMNEAMIRNWNKRVMPEDTIFHLGDFHLGSARGCGQSGQGLLDTRSSSLATMIGLPPP